MAQLHCYVSETMARKVQERAAAAGLSTSRYIAELIRHEVSDRWPEGYFEQVVGGWQGEALTRPEQPQLALLPSLPFDDACTDAYGRIRFDL